jgi:hypothetical protein
LLADVRRTGLPPLVLAPTVHWEIALFQRPQQLAIAAAEMGWPVVYLFHHEAPREVRPNIYVVNDVREALEAFERFVFVVFSTTHQSFKLEHLSSAGDRAIVAYDFIDEQHEHVYDLDDDMRLRHDHLVRDADLVLVTADRLEEQVRAVRDPAKPIVRSPNAVDLNHFDSARHYPRPGELRGLRGRAIVGYYGALASWFDYALVDHLARVRQELDIVLIGIDYDRTLARSGLLQNQNVHFLGPRPYDELPAYLAHFDVATIPFVLNDITESTSPIKLFEYMAGGRPIVTTDMRECRKYRSVSIAHDRDEFVTLIDRAIATKDDFARRALLAEEARGNSWAQRVTDLYDAAMSIARARGWPIAAQAARAAASRRVRRCD